MLGQDSERGQETGAGIRKGEWPAAARGPTSPATSNVSSWDPKSTVFLPGGGREGLWVWVWS